MTIRMIGNIGDLMSISLRPSDARGHAQHGWLDSRHSFSFADYYDPAHMGFRSLRVINDDVIDGASGFPTHPHRDMEIISYVVSGALAHRDSTGSAGIIRRGDIQAMSAGTGVRHSEFNALTDAKTRFLQIWIIPSIQGAQPAYRQATVPDEEKRNRLRLVVGSDGGGTGLDINQDVRVYAGLLDAGQAVRHDLAQGRGAWLQIVDGDIRLNGVPMKSGDGAAIDDVADLTIESVRETELLLFDMG
jgi:redox-sensitive bicupin YhaK (pirin superfamily)